MHFLVQDRNSIEHGIRVRSSYVVISIRDPDKRKVRIRKQAGLRDSLHLAFHDAEPAGNMVLPHDITLMTAEHAKEIWQSCAEVGRQGWGGRRPLRAGHEPKSGCGRGTLQNLRG